MGKPLKGDIVVVPFPFSDLSAAKRRPALVVARAGPSDLILAQVTSRPVGDDLAVLLDEDDFLQGGLQVASNVRPNRLFTADRALVLYVAGQVSPRLSRLVADRIKGLLDAE